MKVPLNEVLHGKLTFFDMAKNLQTICSAVGQQKKLLLLHNLCLKMNKETFLDDFLSNLKIWREKKSLLQLKQLPYKKYGPFFYESDVLIFFDRSLVEAVQGIALSQTFFVSFPQILEYFIIL